MDTTLSLKNVTKNFFTQQSTVTVIKDCSIEFYMGKSYGIIGPSGSGKTTVLHIIGGIEKPTVGTVLYNGTSIDSFTDRARADFLHTTLGLAFQEPFLLPELTTLENVLFKDLIAHKNLAEAKKEGLKLLEEAGLADKASLFPCTLSGGQAQRVALLRALYKKPSFLLADEPIAHLDKDSQKSILDMILRAQKEWGMGVLISSHDTGLIQAMDKVYQVSDQNLLDCTDSSNADTIAPSQKINY